MDVVRFSRDGNEENLLLWSTTTQPSSHREIECSKLRFLSLISIGDLNTASVRQVLSTRRRRQEIFCNAADGNQKQLR